MVLAVVLIAELVAVTLALARPDAPFLTELARVSMFLQWLGLTNAGLLCYSRRWLAAMTVPRSSAAAFALILLNTLVISEFALWLGTAQADVGAAKTIASVGEDVVPIIRRRISTASPDERRGLDAILAEIAA